MIYQTERVYKIKYVEYDGKILLGISVTIWTGKIGEVWKIVKILDFDMGEMAKIDFLENLKLIWLRILPANTNSNT